MVLLTVDKLSKSYTDKTLLDETGFSIESGDKVAIIGINGTGKSTLLKIIAEKEHCDSGTMMKASALSIGYLPQNPDLNEENTVLSEVMAGVSAELKDAKQYECKSILTKLGITDFDAVVKTLSGGQQKRVALACVLIRDFDLLILDEPTNHIDSDMVTWLEDFLKKYRGALLMVTHDRYFLNRVTNKILELDKGKLYSYTCNYTAFLEQKSQRESIVVANERKRQSLIKKEVEWILQGPCGRGTKSQYRIDRLEKLKSAKVDLSTTSVELSSMQSRLGRKVIEIDNVSKSYGTRHLIKDFSYLLLRNDRIGIIGPNGTGKSTLLNMIMGELTPDSGSIVLGQTVKVGYFSQTNETMDPTKRPIEYIKDDSNAIETPEGTLTAGQLLEKFLFTPDLQYTTISRLSGGEKRRLYLMKILILAPNVLILDEPTNDLDIETLTILEDYLETFQGAVIMVSHDRYFLDKCATSIFSFEDGTIKSYIGGYTDWTIQRQETELVQTKPLVAEKVQNRPKQDKLKFSFNEKREFDVIDDQIATVEDNIKQVDQEMSDYSSNYVLLQELTIKKEQLELQLEEKMDRWIYLNDLNDRINATI